MAGAMPSTSASAQTFFSPGCRGEAGTQRPAECRGETDDHRLRGARHQRHALGNLEAQRATRPSGHVAERFKSQGYRLCRALTATLSGDETAPRSGPSPRRGPAVPRRRRRRALPRASQPAGTRRRLGRLRDHHLHDASAAKVVAQSVERLDDPAQTLGVVLTLVAIAKADPAVQEIHQVASCDAAVGELRVAVGKVGGEHRQMAVDLSDSVSLVSLLESKRSRSTAATPPRSGSPPAHCLRCPRACVAGRVSML